MVLGFDGVDPDLVDRWIEELPTIRRLGEQGTLSTLGTTNPPESPVAWASFATGLNPGRHGIFDFLRRDPATYMPDIGLVKVEKPRFLFKTIPIRGARLTNNRKGVPFWEQLDRAGIVTANLRLPLEFPARPLDHGTTLSGLGVPDVRGTWGTYFYLSTDVSRWDLQDTEFGGRVIRLEGEDGRFQAQIDGPADPREEELVRLTIPLSVELDPQSTYRDAQAPGSGRGGRRGTVERLVPLRLLRGAPGQDPRNQPLLRAGDVSRSEALPDAHRPRSGRSDPASIESGRLLGRPGCPARPVQDPGLDS